MSLTLTPINKPRDIGKFKVDFISSDEWLDYQKGAISPSGYHYPLNVINWENYPHNPGTEFYLGFSEEGLVLSFRTSHDYIRTQIKKTNDMVCRDSCVELFFSFDSLYYYNLEINANGVVHLGYGPSRGSRELFSPASIREYLKVFPSKNFSLEEEGDISDWSILATIDKEILKAGWRWDGAVPSKIYLNAYKCGDLTKVPHYVTLFPIETLSPDFHRPEFFVKVPLR